MPVKIRLMRIGAKKRPFYRVVALDERRKRTGGYIELLGTYNPLTNPHETHLKQDRIDDWIKKGAQMSDGFLRIIGKAPQKPPRKPKKPAQNAPSATPPITIQQQLEEEKTESEKPVTGEETAPREVIPERPEVTKSNGNPNHSDNETNEVPEEEK